MAEEIDQSLFPDKASMQDAEKLWADGQEEADKANPQGTFTCDIESATLERSASSDNLQINYQLTIDSGQYKGVNLPKYDGLSSPKRAAITQQQLKRLGIDTKKLTLRNLPAALLDLKGKKVVVSAKQNGEFYNVNFIKLANSPVTESAGRPAPASSGKAPGKRKF